MLDLLPALANVRHGFNADLQMEIHYGRCVGRGNAKVDNRQSVGVSTRLRAADNSGNSSTKCNRQIHRAACPYTVAATPWQYVLGRSAKPVT
jgi:hypothetical protein